MNDSSDHYPHLEKAGHTARICGKIILLLVGFELLIAAIYTVRFPGLVTAKECLMTATYLLPALTILLLAKPLGRASILAFLGVFSISAFVPLWFVGLAVLVGGKGTAVFPYFDLVSWIAYVYLLFACAEAIIDVSQILRRRRRRTPRGFEPIMNSPQSPDIPPKS